MNREVVVIPLGHGQFANTVTPLTDINSNIQLVAAELGTCSLHHRDSLPGIVHAALMELLPKLEANPNDRLAILKQLAEYMGEIHAPIAEAFTVAARTVFNGRPAINYTYNGVPMTTVIRPYSDYSVNPHGGLSKAYTPYGPHDVVLHNVPFSTFLAEVATASQVAYPDYLHPLVLYTYMSNGIKINRLVHGTYPGITMHEILNLIHHEINENQPVQLRFNFSVIDAVCSSILDGGKQHTRKRKDKNLYRSESIKNRRKSRKNRRKSRKNRRKFNRRR